MSGSFFDLLGVPPLLGRALSPADDLPGGGSNGPVAVISYDFWQRHFGGATAAIGAPLLIERIPFTVVGVTPPDFFGLDVGRAFDVAVPIQSRDVIEGSEKAAGPSGALVRIVARLRPGATIDTATAALRGVQPQIRLATLPQGWPKVFLDRYLNDPFVLSPASTGASLLRRRFSRPLFVIMGGAVAYVRHRATVLSVREHSLPMIRALVDGGPANYLAAYRLAEQAERSLPDDPMAGSFRGLTLLSRKDARSGQRLPGVR